MKKTYLIFIILGVIFIIFGCYGIFGPQKDYLATEGVITEIYEHPDLTNDSMTADVFVDYRVNGKKYEHVPYGSYNSFMKVGDTVTVYYEMSDPEKIQAEGYKTVPYVMNGAGIIAVIAGFLLKRKQSA